MFSLMILSVTLRSYWTTLSSDVLVCTMGYLSISQSCCAGNHVWGGIQHSAWRALSVQREFPLRTPRSCTASLFAQRTVWSHPHTGEAARVARGQWPICYIYQNLVLRNVLPEKSMNLNTFFYVKTFNMLQEYLLLDCIYEKSNLL